ncbi:ROK family protein [Paenibacillus tepidiphilus]|uniref:ROK family protein n=1 Tax=Paenibacillus tepidiphilus TaxID=2608683 RepID=UPI0012386171|nr:ROK family protein [Paenibacillus tepidiphilus]
MRRVIGVDIGGTAIKGLVLDEMGNVWAEAGSATEARQGREAILGKLHTVISELLKACTVEAIGIASAGRINTSSGEVVYATDNLPGWQGLQLAGWARETFLLPAAADNDANAALLGEAWQGAGRGRRSLAMLTLGTGVGGAFMIDGVLSRGKHWSGGDFGHSILFPGGRPCNCGRRGCAEQYVSGSALLRLGQELTGRTYTHGSEIMAEARRGEPGALRVLDGYTADLAVVLDNIAVTLDPELIVIGGGVIHDRDIWWKLLKHGLQGEGVYSILAAAELGNRAGCFGAAKLALDGLRRQAESYEQEDTA